jgi:hypothetical protein
MNPHELRRYLVFPRTMADAFRGSEYANCFTAGSVYDLFHKPPPTFWQRVTRFFRAT